MEIYVTKADGSRQLFDKNKVIQTCLRLGADNYIARAVEQKIESRVYNGIPTSVVLQMIFRFMRRDKPAVTHVFDLKRGISLMEPKPEFEVFIRALLSKNGFEVTANQILRGKCGLHEVDAIARKDGVTYFVEVKHHFSYHALTGLDESRIAWAILEDVTEAYEQGQAGIKIDSAMIVTNTRYSEHAIRYGACKKIVQIGWTSPEHFGVRDFIEKHKFYPLSCLRGLDYNARTTLVNNNIVTVSQLLALDSASIERKTGLVQTTVLSILEKARHSAETLWKQD